jgi:hypothetical protein
MEKFSKTIKIKDIKTLPGLQPRKDEVFLYLLEEALLEKIQVYYAAVPLGLIKPFDETYDPRLHPIGAEAIKQTIELWTNGKFSYCWVYPKADKFILSDDYIVYFAAIEGQPDYLPCFILGNPHFEGVENIQGPISIETLKGYLGFD